MAGADVPVAGLDADRLDDPLGRKSGTSAGLGDRRLRSGVEEAEDDLVGGNQNQLVADDRRVVPYAFGGGRDLGLVYAGPEALDEVGTGEGLTAADAWIPRCRRPGWAGPVWPVMRRTRS